MNPAPLPDITNLIGTAGLIAVLIWFCRAFLVRWETSQAAFLEALQGIIKENNELLSQVRDAIQRCPGNGDTALLRKPSNHYERHPHPTHPKPEALD
jgi:hypothetical protein